MTPRGGAHPWLAAALAAAGIAGLSAGNAGAGGDAPPATVERVELDRYAGLWYEIARIPNRFQRRCAGDTTARYALRDDGRLDVINRCRTTDGGIEEVRGVARVVDSSTNARLEVSFVRLFGWNPFWGKYWVIGLDPQYRYAVVGHPQRKYGWILAREPSLDDATRAAIDQLLRDRGYQPASFEPSPRTVPSP